MNTNQPSFNANEISETYLRVFPDKVAGLNEQQRQFVRPLCSLALWDSKATHMVGDAQRMSEDQPLLPVWAMTHFLVGNEASAKNAEWFNEHCDRVVVLKNGEVHLLFASDVGFASRDTKRRIEATNARKSASASPNTQSVYRVDVEEDGRSFWKSYPVVKGTRLPQAQSYLDLFAPVRDREERRKPSKQPTPVAQKPRWRVLYEARMAAEAAQRQKAPTGA